MYIASILLTANVIAASEYLFNNHDFQYVLPAVFSQVPAEIFFGQARQHFGGNFYIYILDVIAAGNVQQMHQLVKYDWYRFGNCIYYRFLKKSGNAYSFFSIINGQVKVFISVFFIL